MWKVQLFKLNYNHQEADAVKEVVESGWITMGEKTKEFEFQFAKLLQEEIKCTAVTNCTAALHMALLALEIKKGDEVIIPALTFVADINVVKLVGAQPVLADCDSYENWNVSASTLEKVITSKTKAIIIVHFAGFPCDMDGIVRLCKEKKIALIEDCAHAPGAKYKQQAVGTFGDFGCFSFFTNKNLSVGEGGMIVSKDASLDQQAKFFRSHGMTALTLDRHEGRAITYDVAQCGLNYRTDEMRSALGIIQLGKLKTANMKRKTLVDEYVKLLTGTNGLSIPFLDMKDVDPVYHIFPVLLSPDIDRLHIINQLKGDGIQSSIHYPAFKDFTAFKDLGLNTATIAEDITTRELTLPLYPTMTIEETRLVVDSVKRALGG